MYSRAMPVSYKGRGALSNPDARFLAHTTEAVDDGWFVEEPPTSIATTVEPDRARSVISTNDSPDVPFDQSVNPYRGCEHGCVYCMSGDTQVLMADGTVRALALLRTGDAVYGTARPGWHRRYVKTRVLAHWSVVKPALRITLADGTVLTAGFDHRFLTERGWKFVTGAVRGRERRPHLTAQNKLVGVGAFAPAPVKDVDYRTGYLCGLIRGDGLIGAYAYPRSERGYARQPMFRLPPCDTEALERAQEWLRLADAETSALVLGAGSARRRPVQAIRTHARRSVASVRDLIAWPSSPSRGWQTGFLAGIFDAEGSYSGGCLRMSNTDPQIIDWIGRSLRALEFDFVAEHIHRTAAKPIDVIRVLGDLRAQLRFFHCVDPAIVRKRDISGQAVKSAAQLEIVKIEPVGGAMRLFDITTGTEDFIANGVVSHNCYARPSHAYLGLSPGLDFETRLFYKADAAQLLTAELGRPGYVCKPLALGANTDPYQPVEKRLGVTRSILEVLHDLRHPVSIVTKGTLILRDLDLLTEMAGLGLTKVFVSITTLDAELKRVLEPRAASPRARLEVVRHLAGAGVPVGVLVAPIIPAITDHELESILEAAAGAGARGAGYVLLRLPNEVSELFREWLAAHYPDRAQHVMSLLQDLRGGRDNDPRFGSRMRGTGPFAELLRARFQLACRRCGIESGRRVPLETSLFRPPQLRPNSNPRQGPGSGGGTGQLELGF